MIRKRTAVAACVVVLAASGCVLPRDHEALVGRTEKAEKDLEQSKRELAALRGDLDATRQRLDNALRANADGATDVLSTKQRLNDLAGRLDETHHSVDELKRDLAATRSELYARIDEMKRTQPAPAVVPQQAVPAEKAAHFTALKDAYAKRDWALVRALGPEYVNRYATDEHADEALFFVGDGDLADGRPSSSLGHMNRLLKLFPRSKLLDRALLDMGEAYLMMHDCTNAKLAFQACESRFSKEKAGADARVKLAQIAKNPPGMCAPP